jgi:hypothetical protein
MRLTIRRMLDLEKQTTLPVTPRALRGVQERAGRAVAPNEVCAAASDARRINPVELDLQPGFRASSAGEDGRARWHFLVEFRDVQFVAELGRLPRSRDVAWLETWDVYDVTGLPRVWSVDPALEPWRLS